ncbi:acyltransferase family protein [Flavicella marina]|uniref:acyltransferase family protein n=1 Tax=Flavicella marina TaxID=1475951 RepID=UPI00126429D6|nr:heparan-alpha-glucosaminide N-acetyltransferase domain-containing protein [Flavicella marina]
MRNRIQSVDILRGFTIAAMILVNTPGDWNHVYAPLLHANWHGLTPTDLIFPFFLFIVGISISYAYKNAENTRATYKKILIRSLKLIGLGLFLNIFIPYFPFVTDLSNVRIPGVLQRIGIVFFISSLLFLNFNWKTLFVISLGTLSVYWLFTGFFPMPNGSLPTLDRAPNNWANYIDLQLLQNHTWQKYYDPEGLLSTIPSIVTCLFGILLGKILQIHADNKVNLLLLTAFSFLVIGYIWSIWYPVNKALWTGSFVFITAGYGTLFLTIIYYFSDEIQLNFGQIFKYAGTNAITIYFLSSLISKCFYMIHINETETIHSYVYNNYFFGIIGNPELASLLYAASVTIFYLVLAYIMYRKKWIIKV